MRVNAVVVAAGEGRRIGGNLSKSYLPIEGRPLILHTLSRFLHSQRVRKVILVVKESDLAKCNEIVRGDSSLTGLSVVFERGGSRRQDSVCRGLEKLDEDCEVVLIHDGARPFVSPSLIDRCVGEAYVKEAVVPGLRVRDTIKVVASDGRVQKTLARDYLWEIQTPQAFRTAIIREAHKIAVRDGIEATDDAMLVERLGKSVFLLEGERTNIKITVPEDLSLATLLLREGRVS